MKVDCFLIYNLLYALAIEACMRQRRWPTAPISEWYQNTFDTLAYLEELLNYDWGVHWPPVSIHDIHVFCRAMLWQNSQLWSRKLQCYLPQQSPLKCTMNAKIIPALRFSLSCNIPSPQQYSVSCLPQLHLQSVIPAPPPLTASRHPSLVIPQTKVPSHTIPRLPKLFNYVEYPQSVRCS